MPLSSRLHAGVRGSGFGRSSGSASRATIQILVGLLSLMPGASGCVGVVCGIRTRSVGCRGRRRNGLEPHRSFADSDPRGVAASRRLGCEPVRGRIPAGRLAAERADTLRKQPAASGEQPASSHQASAISWCEAECFRDDGDSFFGDREASYPVVERVDADLRVRRDRNRLINDRVADNAAGPDFDSLKQD